MATINRLLSLNRERIGACQPAVSAIPQDLFQETPSIRETAASHEFNPNSKLLAGLI
jgi:hypothetical protein